MTETTAMDDAPDDPLENFVHTQCASLWRGYQADRAKAVADLAQLRHTVPANGMLHPVSWEFFERTPGLPEQPFEEGDDPTRTELAAAAALAFFALHQQSRRTASMHRRGSKYGLGAAAYRAKRATTGSDGIERRMQALLRSQRIGPILEQLRALIKILRDYEIPLDYARLATDLRGAQTPNGLRGVRVRWSRDFYRPGSKPTDDTDTTSGETA
jgi:CRISPR system Cascade subunit CasB